MQAIAYQRYFTLPIMLRPLAPLMDPHQQTLRMTLHVQMRPMTPHLQTLRMRPHLLAPLMRPHQVTL